ncbi:MAG: hypothetical protein ABII64_04850 [Elusimicrobiota bacterium]
MMKRAVVLFLVASCLAGIAFAEGNPAYFVLRQGFRKNLVNVDGRLLTLKNFNELCKEKSPAAVEQLKMCSERRISSISDGIFSCVFVIAGYNRYLSSRDITDSNGIATRQAEGIGFMVLGVINAINSHTSGIAAQDAQNRAIELYNRDTGRIKLSLGAQTSPAGFTLSKKF